MSLFDTPITDRSVCLRLFLVVILVIREADLFVARPFTRGRVGGMHVWTIGEFTIFFGVMPDHMLSPAARWVRRFARQLPHRFARARLFCTPWRVFVAHHMYCCDTGAFTRTTRHPNGREAWRATTPEAMSHGDGPERYTVLSRRDYLDALDRAAALTWDDHLTWDEQLADRRAEVDERDYDTSDDDDGIDHAGLTPQEAYDHYNPPMRDDPMEFER